MDRIRTHRDLVAWQKSHELVLIIYKLTSLFPKLEIFTLVSQMRRCAISIVSNIAEGFARKGSKEKVQFYFQAKASLTELECQLEIANDLKYLPLNQYEKIQSLIIECHKLLSGLIKNKKG